MRFQIKAILWIISLFLTGCVPFSDWWNNNYTNEGKAVRTALLQRESYYSAESSETKAQRRLNEQNCLEEANRLSPLPARHPDDDKAAEWGRVYRRCMSRKGTPIWQDG